MKKLVSKLVTFTLLLSLMIVLTGCGEKDKFIGTWKTEMELASQINKELASDEELAKYVKVNSFVLALNFTFHQDGTYVASIDKDSLDNSILGMKDDFAKGMRGYIEAMIQSEGFDMSIDEFFDLTGMTFEELIEESLSGFDTESLVGEFNTEGNYLVENGKLYLSDGKDMGVDKNVYDVYEFDGADIKLIENVGGDDAESLKAFYPMVLKKVQ